MLDLFILIVIVIEEGITVEPCSTTMEQQHASIPAYNDWLPRSSRINDFMLRNFSDQMLSHSPRKTKNRLLPLDTRVEIISMITPKTKPNRG